ncbi:MAG: hypothetical protein SGI72_10375 [Planctomycetota bacterium]|nr:hypothetical protein [Planctomycetota bacterium]
MTNTSPSPYRSRSIWSAERPETLVVCCSDGRWHAPIFEYVDHEISDRADLYAVPGGPAAFDPWSSSFEEARVLYRAFHLFEEHHDLRAVWLIQHAGCAYYRVKYPGQSEADVVERHIRDLHRAAQCIRTRNTELEVRAIMATLVGEQALFTTVDVTDRRPQDVLAVTTQLI